MGNLVRLGILGFLLMINFAVSYFLAGILNSFLFIIIPTEGMFMYVGLILSWVITALILAVIILYIVRRFH